jgi:TetR/AcrR family transcriptional regulator, transcriptional repressor for nem operon
MGVRVTITALAPMGSPPNIRTVTLSVITVHGWNSLARNLLIMQPHHLVPPVQIYPKLNPAHAAAGPEELLLRHLGVNHADARDHPRHYGRPYTRRVLPANSKDQIVAEACAVAAEVVVGRLASSASKKSPQSGLKTIAASYLSARHRDDPSEGCPVAALGSEIARCDKTTRAAATETFLRLVNVIAAQFGKTRPDIARWRALVAASTMIGALTMSRIVTDSELSAAILQQTEKHLVNSFRLEARSRASRRPRSPANRTPCLTGDVSGYSAD